MTTTSPASQLVLERVALGEIDGAPFGIAPDDARIAALRADDAEIRARFPRDVVVARVNTKVAQGEVKRARNPIAFAAPAFVVAAVALLVVVGRDAPPPDAPTQGDDVTDVTISKGLTPALAIYVAHDGTSSTTTPLDRRARAGDRLPLAVVAAGRTHGVIVSIDGRGDVTLHAPNDVDSSTSLSSDNGNGNGNTQGEHRLPHSFELDDAPSFERFILVTSTQPIDVGAVLDAARAVARGPRARDQQLALAAPLEQWSRVVEKEER